MASRDVIQLKQLNKTGCNLKNRHCIKTCTIQTIAYLLRLCNTMMFFLNGNKEMQMLRNGIWHDHLTLILFKNLNQIRKCNKNGKICAEAGFQGKDYIFKW